MSMSAETIAAAGIGTECDRLVIGAVSGDSSSTSRGTW
jgi:hypothetical protein